MNDFEEHARRAAADAQESVTRLAVPDFGDSSSSPARRVLIAAAVIAVVAITGFLLGRSADDSNSLDVVGDPDRPENVTSTLEEGRFFTFEIQPEWTVSATELPHETPTEEVGVTLLGAAAGSDPIGDGFVMVATVAGTERELGPAFDDRRVRGTTGYVTDELSPGSTGLEWIEPDGTLVQLASNVLHTAQLVELANSMMIDGVEVTLPELPDGMSTVVDRFTGDDLATVTNGWRLAAFADDQSSGGSLTGGGGSEAALHFVRVIYGAFEPIDLRGGIGYTTPRADAALVVWREAGTILSLVAPAGRDPVEMAGEVRPISDDEWDALLDRSLTDDTDPDARGNGLAGGDRSLTSGAIAVDDQNFEWTLSERPDGTQPSICIDILSTTGGAGSCVPLGLDPGRATLQAGVDGVPGWVLGVAPDQTERLVLTTNFGGRELPMLSTNTGELVFGTMLEGGELPITLRALGGNGTPLRSWSSPLETPQRDITGSGSRRTDDGGICYEIDYLESVYEACSPTGVVGLELDGTDSWLIAAWTPGCTDWVTIDGVDPAQRVPSISPVGLNSQVITVVEGAPTGMTAHGPTGTATIDLTDPDANWTGDWLCGFEQPAG
ncbi:MAG: hypothetical protein AAGA90_22895 [Actinomycetota bacterium]